MICPECGAEIKDYLSLCPLCGKIIDKEKAFKDFILKGDQYFKSDEIDKAIVAYLRAFDYQKENEDINIKLGLAYMKKNDRKAAQFFLKALSINFYNENVHNLLISFYSKFNKLEELKTWYIKNKEKFDGNFIDKFIKIIDNTILFTTEKSIKIGAQSENIFQTILKSMKSYFMLNMVFIIVFFILVSGSILSFLFKINISFFLILSLVFFILSFTFVIFKKKKNIKKASREINLEEFLKDKKN